VENWTSKNSLYAEKLQRLQRSGKTLEQFWWITARHDPLLRRLKDGVMDFFTQDQTSPTAPPTSAISLFSL